MSTSRETKTWSRWLGPCLVVLSGAAMLKLSWLRFVDPVVDFGREAYVPWRLSQGAVLYRDVAYFNGPLSPYLNSLLFALFGSSLRTLFAANGFLLLLLTREIYRTICFVADRFTATCCCLLFVVVFGFGEIIGTGNYNYIGPYSHEMTHGIFLSLLAFSRLRSYIRRGRRRHLVAAAVLLGLVSLTKPEFLVALGPALLLFVLVARRDRPGISRLLEGALVAALPPLAALLLLSSKLPLRQAFFGLLGGFRYLFGSGVSDLYYYKYGMGILDPTASLLTIAELSIFYAAAIAIPAVICLASPRIKGSRLPACCLLLVEGIALLEFEYGTDYRKAALPFPLLLLVMTAVCLNEYRKTRSPRLAYLSSLSLFALLLLAKMALNTRLFHYGFVLAMPATLLLGSALLFHVPRYIEKRHGDPLLFRVAAMIMLAVIAIPCVRQSIRHYERKTHLVGKGANSIWVGERGRLLMRAIAYLRWETLPGERLFVLPEGALVNFLSGLKNPTPYVTFMPPELLMFHEETMLAAIRRDPPDVVILIHLDTSLPYRMRFFGRDYAKTIAGYVGKHYVRQVLFGAKPFTGRSFGIEILRRLEPLLGEPHQPLQNGSLRASDS